MGTYRCLLLGCGGRATAHISVYPGLRHMRMVAVCDRIEERREAVRAAHGVPAAYADFETALREARPDIVHVVTQPGHRVWEAECCAQSGVKAMIIEKPMAVKPSDLEGLERVHRESGMKIIHNCQRRYFPQFGSGMLRDIVHDRLGTVYFVRASTKGNAVAMGPHLMDLVMLLLDDAQPSAVWATAHTINEEGYQASHLAPESLLAQYWFPGDVRVVLDCSPDALGTPGEDSFWMHLHLDVLGTDGRLFVTQNRGYCHQSRGMPEPVVADWTWEGQADAGQRDFTQAVADWLDGGRPHLNRFELACPVMQALFAAQKSAYVGSRVELPTTFADEQWQALRDRLGQG